MRSVFFVFMLSFNLFCVNMGDSTYEQLEPQDIPQVVTYQEHISAILTVYCVECHSSQGRFGVQGGFDYGNYLVAKANYFELERTALKERSMPPGTKARPSSKSLTLLRLWQQHGLLEK